VQVVGVLLAAGGGQRFTGTTHKLLAPLHGRPVFEHALVHLLDADVGATVVVLGAVALPLPPHVITVHNPRWADGQATSLQAAVAAADSLGADAVVIGLADQPFIPSSAWRAVAEADTDRPIVVASFDGVRGPNPVRLHRSVWPQLPVGGDEGARSLIRADPSLVHEVLCVGSSADIDTPEDLDRWTRS
jgi:CTP:molybdopterin cytidylyltransferase MocA